MFSVIWWAASATGARRPASALAAENTPTSRVTCMAAGNPSHNSRINRDRSIAQDTRLSP